MTLEVMILRLTPRRPEIDRVTEILVSDDFESPEAMAKALLKMAGEAIAHRESWVVAWGFAVTGPYGSQKDAEKAAERMPQGGADKPPRVIRVAPTARLQALENGGDSWPGNCECGHPKTMHLAAGSSYGKCAIDKCCKQWMEIKR